MKTVGQYIKEHRKAAGLTQEQLADLSDIPRVTIAYYETDHRLPGILNAMALADALNVSLDDLVGRKFTRRPLDD